MLKHLVSSDHGEAKQPNDRTPTSATHLHDQITAQWHQKQPQQYNHLNALSLNQAKPKAVSVAAHRVDGGGVARAITGAFLPGLELVDAVCHTHTVRAVDDVVAGAIDEVKNHPRSVLKDVAIGAGIAVLTVATGGGFAVGLGIAAVVAAGSEVSAHGVKGAPAGALSDARNLAHTWEGWGHDFATVAAPGQSASPEEEARAKQGLRACGAFDAHAVAGIAGGFAGGFGAAAAGLDGVIPRTVLSTGSRIASGTDVVPPKLAPPAPAVEATAIKTGIVRPLESSSVPTDETSGAGTPVVRANARPGSSFYPSTPEDKLFMPKDLPALKKGYVRLVHLTSPNSAELIARDGLNFHSQGMLMSTARVLDSTDPTNIDSFVSDDLRFKGATAVAMDVPQDDLLLYNDMTMSPGVVPPRYYVGVVGMPKTAQPLLNIDESPADGALARAVERNKLPRQTGPRRPPYDDTRSKSPIATPSEPDPSDHTEIW